MAISFVSMTSSTSQTDDASLQIVKPSGIASGDLMIAAIATFPGQHEEQVTTTPPAGWTLHLSIHEMGGDYPCQLDIMYRVATGSEPSTWNGTFSENQVVEATICCAYRGVTGGIDTVDNSVGSATSVSSGSITNSDASNWRITIGAYASSTINYTIDSNEVTEREIAGIKKSSINEAVQLGFWDSGGSISTGSHSRNVTRDAVWSAAHAVVGILSASDLTSSGTMDMSIPLTQVAMAGEATGGTLDTVIPLTVVAMAGAQTTSGTLAGTVTPVMKLIGDNDNPASPTGIRVVRVEAEKRRLRISFHEMVEDYI